MKSLAGKYFFLVPIFFLMMSCGLRREMIYLQDADKAKADSSEGKYEPTLQPDDLLSIVVSTDNPEIATPFNIPDIASSEGDFRGLKTYLIDNTGYIDYPVLGKVKMAGLTKTEANLKLVSAISEYIKSPTVSMRILNFKIAALGEVGKPGTYNINGERVTLLEALSYAGDLTIYGKRENVLIIREKDGKKTYNRVDLTSSDFTRSPFFYLCQNDVIYVEANQTKLNSSKIGPDIYVLFSGISLLTTIVVILLR